MEVKKIKVIKEVEVEEQMFCLTRDEAALISDILGVLNSSQLRVLGINEGAIVRQKNLFDSLRDVIPLEWGRSRI